jgi:TfoX/Sxy family transcriptional regulator of competence genes
VAYDERLAERVRGMLGRRRAVTERKMFGGIAFLLRGNMCCGVLNDALIVRVDPQGTARALRRRHTRPFDMTGRAINGFVVVTRPGCRNAKQLQGWLKTALTYVRGLPSK